VLELIVTAMDQTLLLLPGVWQPKQLFGFDIPGLGRCCRGVLETAVSAPQHRPRPGESKPNKLLRAANAGQEQQRLIHRGSRSARAPK